MVGGFDDYLVPQASIETFFPGVSCSTSLPNIPNGQSPVGVACFINGTLYSSYMTNACLQLVSYDFKTKKWNSLSCSLSTFFNADPYTCVGSRIYKYNDLNPEYYDTIDKAWHYMSKPKSIVGNEAAMCEANGRLYVFGGATIQVYNTATNIWSVLDSSLTYNSYLSCHKIPGTTKILVFSGGSPSRVGILDTVLQNWLSPQSIGNINYLFGKLNVYGTQVIIQNGNGYSFAYCPNSSSVWQRINDYLPMINPRYVSLVDLVPMSLLNLPATCTPSNYKCT